MIDGGFFSSYQLDKKKRIIKQRENELFDGLELSINDSLSSSIFISIETTRFMRVYIAAILIVEQKARENLSCCFAEFFFVSVD